MLGAAPIAFAMLKTKASAQGATVLVNAEGEQANATVTPLQFWPEPAGASVGDDASSSPSTDGDA